MLLAKVHDADHHLTRFEIQISNRLEETAMAYNHRKAELEWLRWKEQEEKQLRELGVDEDAIQRLHTYDWKQCALPGFVDSKNEEKTERNAGYLVVSHSGGGMLRQGTREGIRRTPANRGMRAHRIVKGLDISEDVCHGLCP